MFHLIWCIIGNHYFTNIEVNTKYSYSYGPHLTDTIKGVLLFLINLIGLSKNEGVFTFLGLLNNYTYLLIRHCF